MATSSRLFSAFKGKKQNRNANEHNHVFALPYDVLVQIIAFLPDSDALLKLSLLSRSLRETLLPALYNCVDLRSSASCRAALTFFLQNPTGSSASLIRSLTLRPSNPERWGGATDKPDEQWVAAAIEQLATAGHLNALHTFVWDGWESPPESLWLALRLNCPYLRSIGTSVGLNSQKIDPESSLFDFRDLRGFSLVTQKYVRWKNLFTGQALPDRFWQMLIHSPNLEDLKLDGSCAISQLWDIRRVLTGRWPRLHTLSIGDLSAQSTDTDFPSATTFLRAQPLLTSISFTGGLSAHTNSISALPLAPLPNLRTFVGKVIQLKDASSTLLPCLTEFRFTDHFGTRSSSLSILTRFYKTTRLELYVNFLDAPTETDIETFFRHLLVPCPILRHLRINATSPFNLEMFFPALELTPILQSFILTLPRPRLPLIRANTAKFALRLGARYPQLEEFSIRHVTDWDMRDEVHDMYRLVAEGRYTVLVGGHAEGRYLRIEESSANALAGRSTSISTKLIPVLPST